MKKKKLYVAVIPPVSHEFAQALDKRFSALTVKPGVTQDELLYNAGQRSIVEFVMAVASGTHVSGDIDKLEPTGTSSFLERILGSLRK